MAEWRHTFIVFFSTISLFVLPIMVYGSSIAFRGRMADTSYAHNFQIGLGMLGIGLLPVMGLILVIVFCPKKSV